MARFRSISAWLILLMAGSAHADVHPLLDEKVILLLGNFFSEGDFRGSLDGEVSGDHPEYDFETQFGLDSEENVPTAALLWRYTPKWSAQLQYFNPERTNTAVLQEDVEFGDVVFGQGTTISAKADVEILRIYFGREFSKRENMSYGIGAGIHWLDIDMSLTGNLIASGQQVINGTQRASASAPLPNVGAWYAWSPSPKWALFAGIDWISVSIDEYSGVLLNSVVGVNYQLSKHFGIGANYQVFRLAADIDKPSWHGDTKVSFDGAYLYLSINWN
jgi:hypothetical protein